MRCIETLLIVPGGHCREKINYNMRCIETNPRLSAMDMDSDKLQHEMY